jgi:hypothetical protein
MFHQFQKGACGVKGTLSMIIGLEETIGTFFISTGLIISELTGTSGFQEFLNPSINTSTLSEEKMKIRAYIRYVTILTSLEFMMNMINI